ncbi:MAG TPA: hypothetical protein VFM38_12140, partial [Candidatus Limnocylindrales bacterium]|nr:hypothetical protein [Candidatus Limnocylindrales bacterium]
PAPPSPTASAETRLRPGHESWAMNEVNPLVWPSPAGIGVMVPDEWQHTVDVLLSAGAISGPPPDDAYRTDLMATALDSLEGLDTKGEAFVKGTVEIQPGGG